MKKLFYIAVALGVAAACQSEKITPEDGETSKEQMEFEAKVAETRSVLNGMTPEWTTGETIYIFNNTQKEIYTGQNTAQAASTKFKGNALEGNQFIAVSPKSAVGSTSKADVSKKTVSQITIPTQQTATANSYDPNAFVAVAYTEDNVLTFDAAVSLLKFTMGSDNVTEVTFAGWAGEKLSGTGSISYNTDGKPIVTVDKKYVKLTGKFTKGSTYYVAVAPNTFSKGLLCEFGPEKVRVTESAIELKPNQITDLGEISYSTAYLRGGFNSWGETRMAKCGDWYAAYSVQLNNIQENQDAGFKFTFNGTWYGGSANSATYTELSAGTSKGNITLSGDTQDVTFKNAVFDVFFNPTTKKYKVRVANEREKRKVTIKVKNTVNWGKICAYGWYVSGNTNINVWGNWAGRDITTTKTIEIPAAQFGSQFYYIFNNGNGGAGNQTEDMKVFVTGDFEFDLNSTTLKK